MRCNEKKRLRIKYREEKVEAEGSGERSKAAPADSDSDSKRLCSIIHQTAVYVGYSLREHHEKEKYTLAHLKLRNGGGITWTGMMTCSESQRVAVRTKENHKGGVRKGGWL